MLIGGRPAAVLAANDAVSSASGLTNKSVMYWSTAVQSFGVIVQDRKIVPEEDDSIKNPQATLPFYSPTNGTERGRRSPMVPAILSFQPCFSGSQATQKKPRKRTTMEKAAA